jgi:hypothetical protein
MSTSEAPEATATDDGQTDAGSTTTTPTDTTPTDTGDGGGQMHPMGGIPSSHVVEGPTNA